METIEQVNPVSVMLSVFGTWLNFSWNSVQTLLNNEFVYLLLMFLLLDIPRYIAADFRIKLMSVFGFSYSQYLALDLTMLTIVIGILFFVAYSNSFVAYSQVSDTVSSVNSNILFKSDLFLAFILRYFPPTILPLLYYEFLFPVKSYKSSLTQKVVYFFVICLLFIFWLKVVGKVSPIYLVFLFLRSIWHIRTTFFETESMDSVLNSIK